jgi:hypothetical protein
MRMLVPLLAAVVVVGGCSEIARPMRSIAFWAEGDCVEPCNTDTITNRAFAVDGTIAHVADGSVDPRSFAYVDVTFDVHEWFRGGGTTRVIIQMNLPVGEPSVGDRYDGYYKTSDRLPVMGAVRWGGEPLDNAIA